MRTDFLSIINETVQVIIKYPFFFEGEPQLNTNSLEIRLNPNTNNVDKIRLLVGGKKIKHNVKS